LINSAALKDYKQRIKQAPTSFTVIDAGQAAVCGYLGHTLERVEFAGIDTIFHFANTSNYCWREPVKEYSAGTLVIADAKSFYESAKAVHNKIADAEEEKK